MGSQIFLGVCNHGPQQLFTVTLLLTVESVLMRPDDQYVHAIGLRD